MAKVCGRGGAVLRVRGLACAHAHREVASVKDGLSWVGKLGAVWESFVRGLKSQG